MKSKEKKISIVAPIFNEEGNVEELHREIVEVARKENLNLEIVFVDDGSSDDSLKKMIKLKPLKVVVFRGNFGQTAALDAGVKNSTGEIIVMMDADLQNDPADIPKLLEKMDEGFDVVSGWRKNRKDPWHRNFFSRGADFLRKFLINDKIKDSGCTLKAYKKECFIGVDLFGEMHRFIPALLKIKGFKIGEVVVNHRPRVSGETKYNYKRLLKGLLDLLSVWFWRKFSNRPLHLFGTVGFFMSLSGIIILIWMAIERIAWDASIGDRIWPMIGIFLIIVGIQFFVSGLLADISLKTYNQTKKESGYNIKKIVNNNDEILDE